MTYPDRKQCYKYLEDYKTPEHVVGHCKSVAAVGYAIAKALNEAGGTRAVPIEHLHYRNYVQTDPDKELDNGEWRKFDLDLILAAGLLHDMARVEERHWDVCADFCEEKGQHQLGKAIRQHMKYKYTNDVNHLTEVDMLSLGDRLSLEDHYAGLDDRMDYIIRKAEKRGDSGARERILAKKKETRKLLDDIEARIGCSIDELMAGLNYDNVEGED